MCIQGQSCNCDVTYKQELLFGIVNIGYLLARIHSFLTKSSTFRENFGLSMAYRSDKAILWEADTSIRVYIIELTVQPGS